MKKQREVEQLSEDHPALLILDVFRGQLTKAVVDEMQKHNILMCQVPANVTHIFQPLDLTVNGSAKSFLKAKFTEWCAEKIDEGLEEGKALEDIDIKLTLTLLKPIHGSWICDLYNYLSSSKGKSIIENRWKQAGISKAIEAGFSKLPCLDPFQSIDPLMNESNSNGLSTRAISSICDIDEDILQGYQRVETDDDSDWEHPDYERNVLDIFGNEEACYLVCKYSGSSN